ncbi:hypothetical protein B4135_1728 [Caldibacillus debilis]|uniref:Uncharacterized protein n=1 Tax=Caldibacillus debilis TaxID=301148 RepID=A0A150M8S4_9BACI|nr:hypothetical protein B4135_1728 [Caldibacillus debilis]
MAGEGFEKRKRMKRLAKKHETNDPSGFETEADEGFCQEG